MPDRPTYRPVYKALHRPLTICGVDRRLFFLALLLGAATFNLFYSFLGGLLMFGGLHAMAQYHNKRVINAFLEPFIPTAHSAAAITVAPQKPWSRRLTPRLLALVR